MKKLLLFSSILLMIITGACTGTNKTGGARRDSSASHGYSGPSDSSGQAGTSSIGKSSMGTDTSKTGKPVTETTVDSTRKNP